MASSSSTSLVDLDPDPDPAAVTQTVNGQHDYPTQLKDTAFLYDDCYSSLKNHFCTVGRGRRPPLPTLTAPTHRILAQLGILKDAESRTWEEVTCWFSKIYPDLSMTRGKIEYKCKVVLEKIKQLEGDVLQEYLDTDLALPLEASQILLNLSLTRDVLLKNPEMFLLQTDRNVGSLNNNIVIEIEKFRVKEKQPVVFTSKWIFHILKQHGLTVTEAGVRHKVAQLLSEHKKNKLKRDNSLILNNFLQASLQQSFVNKPHNSNTPSKKKSDDSVDKDIKVDKIVKKYNASLQKAYLDLEKIQLEKKCLEEERDALLPLKREVETTNENNIVLSSEIKALKQEIKRHEAKLAELETTKTYKQNHKLKSKVESQEQTITTLKAEAFKVRADSEKQIEEKKNEIQSLKKKVKVEQTLKKRYLGLYQSKSSELNNLLISEEDKEPKLNLKGKKFNQFSNDVRLMYMCLIGGANVPAEKCAQVVQIVSKHLFKTDIPVEKLPCPSTALNIASEACHVSQHHVATKLKECEHFTFASDGTSREKKHYLERHVILNDKTEMSLGFTEIAVDDSATLLEKTVEILEDLSENLSKSSETVDSQQEKKKELFLEFLNKMKCTMSDRSSVNKSFNQKLVEYKQDLLGGEDASTHFLYCNAHFLLGLVAETENALKSSEHGMGKLGRDQNEQFDSFLNSTETATFRLIRLATEVFGPRGDEKSGCRREWIAYLDSLGKKSKFTSFRSNRFNNLFENASAIIHHKDDMVSFLTHYVSHSNRKLESILQDLADDRIIALVQSVALFHIHFTGPYWALMNSHTSYAAFPVYVSKMKTFLDMYSDANADTDVFSIGSVFTDFVVKADLCNHDSCTSDMHILKSSFKAIAEHCNLVLNRQLQDFLNGGVFGGDISPELMAILKTCPLTNLTGERLFGDLDFDMQKRRHASLHLRSTLNMWKRNKTSKWVNGLKSNKIKELLVDARKFAKPLKARSKERTKMVTELIQQRLQQNMQRKNNKVISKMTYENALLDAVLGQGGICTTQDELVAKPNAVANLKTQIRYRKIVRGENILIGGNLESLYARLCSHLGFERTELPWVGSVKRKRPN